MIPGKSGGPSPSGPANAKRACQETLTGPHHNDQVWSSEPDPCAQLNNARLPGIRERTEETFHRINYAVGHDLVIQVCVYSRELGVVECVEQFETKLELRGLVPKPRFLGQDQVPVVNAVRRPELIESLGASPESGGQIGYNDFLHGIRIECPSIILTRVHLGERRPEVGEADYCAAGSVDIGGIAYAERSP